MSNIETLSPSQLWHFFSQICSIPHPSKHETALSKWIQEYFNCKGLDVKEDNTGNLIIRKPATAGMENRKGAIIQAHLDMVPQKNSGTDHDFITDAIKAFVDGEWVTAEDTTLGADNGIGMASALAVLDSDDIPHGPLEVLLTIDEEAGMTGAFGLQPGWLEGSILINTDSEEEGEVYMGCAGGIDANLELPLKRQLATTDSTALQLKITGLKGGHSGCDIHLGRGNANKLLARLLSELTGGFTISDLSGGSLRNAIPRESQAIILCAENQVNALKEQANNLFLEYAAILTKVEPDMKLAIQTVDTPTDVLSYTSQQTLLSMLNACPNGVIRMSDNIEGVVETSTNLGVVNLHADHLHAQCLIRSLSDSGRREVENMIRALTTLAGANLTLAGAYPGWQPNNSSPIMTTVRETYQQLFGTLPNIMVIHAGLECGLFKTAYPDWDMVSFGPTIRFPHSPDEKVNITSVERYWQLLLAVLKNIPEA